MQISTRCAFVILAVLLTGGPLCAEDGRLPAWRDPIFQRDALRLARAVLTARVLGEPPRIPSDLHPALRRQAGIFISLENRGRVVRGCRGTLAPRTARLADEIVANVDEAALHDPLHPRIRAAELTDLRIILCIPCEPCQVSDGERWDAQRFGVLVEAGERSAVMLPFEAPDSEHQLLWARKRAHIALGESVHLVRFTGVRFAESLEIKPFHRPQPKSQPFW